MGACFSSGGNDVENLSLSSSGSGSDSEEGGIKHFGGYNAANFIIDNPGNVTDFYDLDKKLGQGTYGTVSKAKNKKTKQIRAIKTIAKADIDTKAAARIKEEMQLMKTLDHPGIVRLYESFDDFKNVYLVLEMCQGGELFDRILMEGFFSENRAAHVMKQVLSAIYYLHQNKIAHRDLKPENFLFLEQNKPIEQSTIKIIDFGLSTRFRMGRKMTTKAGTPYYVSPEVLKGEYDELCDVWSAGAILYVLLCGYPPFYGENDKEVMQRVKTGKFIFEDDDWEHASDEAKELIRCMLRMNPAERFTAEQCYNSDWIQRTAPHGPKAVWPKNLQSNLKIFRGGNKLKRAALHVIASQVDADKLRDLREVWEDLDANGDGTISVEEFKEGFAELQKEIPGVVPEDLQKVLDEVDTNASGRIEYTEFLAATMDRKRFLQEDLCWAAFRVFDTSGDGKISKDELAEVLQDPTLDDVVKDEMIHTIFKEVDSDGDGMITFDNFMHMLKKDN